MKYSEINFNDLEDTPVRAFYEVLKTWDFKYLGPDGDEKKWYKIYDAYFTELELKMPKFKLVHKYRVAVARLEYIKILIEIIPHTVEHLDACKDTLGEVGFKYNNKISFKENVDKFNARLEVLETKIELLKQDISEDENEGESKVDVWKELVLLKKHFAGVAFDINVMPCIEWINYKKLIQEDVKRSRHINSQRSKR